MAQQAGQEYIIFLLIFELDFEAESHCIIQVPVGMLLKKFLCPIQQISRRNKFMFIRRGKGSHYSCCICLIMGRFKHGCVNLHLLHRLGICHESRAPSEELRQWNKSYQDIYEANKQERLRKLEERAEEYDILLLKVC